MEAVVKQGNMEPFSLQKLRRMVKPKKRRNGFSLVELGIAMIVLALIVGVAYTFYDGIMDGAKTTKVKDELDVLAKACIQYQINSVAGNPPANLGSLMTGLTAAQSNDRVAKPKFVTRNGWTSDASTFKDPWGNQYVYNAANRTITSTANGGTAITVYF